MFWRKQKVDLSAQQNEADRQLAKEKIKYEANRQEFHNLKAISGIDVMESYIQEIVRQRMRK